MNRFEPYFPALAVPNLLQTTEIFEVKDLKDKLQKDADQMVKASDNFQQVSHYSMHVKCSSSGYLFSIGFPINLIVSFTFIESQVTNIQSQ